MPLTLAHPAAVLPLRRLGLPMSALALGSMVPDVPVFLGRYDLYSVTHAWPGVLTVDLAVTVVGLFVWFALLRDPLVDVSPAAVRSRLPATARLERRGWALVPAAAVIGSATHVVWDAFTHPDVWGTNHLTWLREVHLGLAGHQWAQHVSGVVGLAVVLLAATRYITTLPVARDAAAPRVLPTVTLPAAVTAAALAGLGAAVVRIPDGLRLMAFDAVVTSILTGVSLVVLVAVAWHWQTRRTRV